MLFFIRNKLSKKINERLKNQRASINRLLINLSAGAILLTFTIIQIIKSDFQAEWFLKCSWVFFGFSVLLGVILQIFDLYGDAFWFMGMKYLPKGKEIKDLDEKEHDEFIKDIGTYFKISGIRELTGLSQFICFIIGMFSVIIFMFYNF